MKKEREAIVRVVCIKNLSVNLPFFQSVAAGFPSPADDYLEERLSLDEHLIKNPSTTFFVKVQGHSMSRAGMYDGDIIVVDRSLKAKLGNIIVAIIDGEFTVKRLIRKQGQYFLHPEHPDYPDIPIPKGASFMVWGVVTYTIHNATKKS